MSVIRNRHNANQPFVILDKKTLWNETLSLGALGLWGRCISRPDNWKFCVKELTKRCKIGKDLIYKYFKELIAANICIRLQHRCVLKDDGKIYMGAGPVEYIFLEIPATDAERKKIIFEAEQEFVQELLNEGFKFHDSEYSVATRRFKKSLLLPDLPEAATPETMNPPLPRTKVSDECKKNQRTNTGGCSNPKQTISEESLKDWGVDASKFNLLRKAYSLEQIAIAFEMLKKSEVKITNPYGWIKKCIEGDWAFKEKMDQENSQKLLSENMDFSLHVEKISYGKLLPGSAITIERNGLTIQTGEKIITFKYDDPKFKEKVLSALKRMKINV